MSELFAIILWLSWGFYSAGFLWAVFLKEDPKWFQSTVTLFFVLLGPLSFVALLMGHEPERLPPWSNDWKFPWYEGGKDE